MRGVVLRARASNMVKEPRKRHGGCQNDGTGDQLAHGVRRLQPHRFCLVLQRVGDDEEGADVETSRANGTIGD